MRRGRRDDAACAVSILRRSIRELCVDDHRSDPQEIAAWLANKTEADWRLWLSQQGVAAFMAEVDDTACGVGMTRDDGVILLNYVAPDARFRGVSKALASAMEAHLATLGLRHCRLESTITAQRFYSGLGYRPARQNGARHMMEKTLSPARRP